MLAIEVLEYPFWHRKCTPVELALQLAHGHGALAIQKGDPYMDLAYVFRPLCPTVLTLAPRAALPEICLEFLVQAHSNG